MLLVKEEIQGYLQGRGLRGTLLPLNGGAHLVLGSLSACLAATRPSVRGLVVASAELPLEHFELGLKKLLNVLLLIGRCLVSCDDFFLLGTLFTFDTSFST